MHHASGLFFYLFTFLPLKAAAACYTEGGSDGCPRVVAMAVRKEIAICKIVFQVLAFIMFNF